jgi:tetratricopeptide (TPR) repeat protein
MSESEPDIEDTLGALIDFAESLEHGPGQVALFQEAVRLGDLTDNPERAYWLRYKLMESSMFAGQQDVGLVAFSWCLAKSREQPETFPVANLLWSYKWVVNSLKDFHQFSLAQIEQMFGEMEQCYREHGSTLNVIYLKRMELGLAIGDRPLAEAAYSQFEQTGRDELSDCLACEKDVLVQYFLGVGQEQHAIDLAQDLIKRKFSCAEIPHRTYNHLLLPLLKQGDAPRALDYQRKAYRLIKRNPEFIDYIGTHIVLLALTGNWDRAVKLLQNSLPMGWNVHVPLLKYRYLRGVLFFLDSLATRGGQDPLLRVPKEIRPEKETKQLPRAGLREIVANEVQSLAVAFDRRNGNTALQNELASQHELWQYAVACPLPEKPAKESQQSSPALGNNDE